jgi:hypothetical protein
MKRLTGTKANLANTHTVVESVKKELANVIATVENMKKDANGKTSHFKTPSKCKKFNDILNAFPANVASSIGRMPKSCDDLQKIGHRKSGLFSVMGDKTVDNVYCDFTKPTDDAGTD